MHRIITAAALVVAFVSITAGVIAAQASTASVEVRIQAMRLDDGRIEFALQQREGSGWSERILPDRRFFPTSSTGRWLSSSPIEVSAAVQSQATASPTATATPTDELTILNAPPGVHYKEDGAIIVAGAGGSDSALFRLRVGLWLAGSVGRDPRLAADDPEDWCALWLEDVHGNLEQLRTLEASGQATKWLSIGGQGTVQVFVDPLCGSARWAVGFIPADASARGE